MEALMTAQRVPQQPRKLKWRVLSLLLRTIGKSSDGVALGYARGFDSGEMMDYVYEDQARGRFLIGAVIDRTFLDAPGWRGVRARKELLKPVLLAMIAERRAAGLPTAVLDIAAGPGRYLIEVCQVLATGHGDLTVVCRDLDESCLERGRRRAAGAGLACIRYERGDACDAASLAAVTPRPDVVVASGLYELLPDELIQRSMRGVHAILPVGGRFVFTTQVHHPQLELIANVLVNRNGEPWTMTCRPLEETEGWAREAGFRIVRSWKEPTGLYAVTVAEKGPDQPTPPTPGATSIGPACSSEPAARHARGRHAGLGALAWRYFWQLKWQYLVLMLSDYGREILKRKYDAFATDRAYQDRPSGLLGPVGRWVDRKVLDYPLHVALRQRLRLVADALKVEAQGRVGKGATRVRILSAPCGLVRDVLTAYVELRTEDPRVAASLELHGLDLDATGEVLSAAALRATAVEAPLRLHQADLFDAVALERELGTGRFDVVSCIGLTPWISIEEVERLARLFHDRFLVPGGTLLIDNFAWHQHSALGSDLGMETRYHPPQAFAQALRNAGFRLRDARPTDNGVNAVYVAEAV